MGRGTKTAYDAIWGFKEDIAELRKDFKEHILKAHTSQPVGIPLHRYEGQLALDEKSVVLSGKDKDTREDFRQVIGLDEVTDVFLGWDNVLRRWRDTRAWIKPLRLMFGEHEKSKTLYIYAKNHGERVYGNKNEELSEILGSKLPHTLRRSTALNKNAGAELCFIGVVERTKGEEARIRIFKEYCPGLRGIEEYSHLIILYWSHLRDNDKERQTLLVFPRRHEVNVEKGVFACRSPSRPNPIALCIVQLLKTDECVLTVKGLDAYEGSPIIDVKPYVPRADSIPNAKAPPWTEKGPQT